jgi:predicted AAA+ superfamily ATPase
MERLLYETIWKDVIVFQKMIFISGPRQTGKTTFTKMLAENIINSLYINWDIIDNKKKISQNPYFYEEINRKDNSLPLIIFDELHKYSKWKNYLKGVYDRDKSNYHFIVSGSGRLDIYQKGGDSLAGRFLSMHIWPFTLAEIFGKNKDADEFIKNPLELDNASPKSNEIWKTLSHTSGFPDPYLKNDTKFYNRWSETYHRQLLREDIRDISGIKNIDLAEILFSLIPGRIGSPISFASLAEDVKVSSDTIKNWLEVFERTYLLFRIDCYKEKLARAIQKEKKIYLFDFARIQDEGAKFENMVAVELLRLVSGLNDRGYGVFDLNYIRTRDKEEVDFVLLKNRKPFLLIETKLSDDTVSKHLIKFQNILHVPAIQLVQKMNVYKIISNDKNKILIVSAAHWLKNLP